jgi:hypothetical protein
MENVEGEVSRAPGGPRSAPDRVPLGVNVPLLRQPERGPREGGGSLKRHALGTLLIDIDLAGPPDVPGFIAQAVSVYILKRIRRRADGISKARQKVSTRLDSLLALRGEVDLPISWWNVCFDHVRAL